jgi:hypothetical protein
VVWSGAVPVVSAIATTVGVFATGVVVGVTVGVAAVVATASVPEGVATIVVALATGVAVGVTVGVVMVVATATVPEGVATVPDVANHPETGNMITTARRSKAKTANLGFSIRNIRDFSHR